MQHTEVPWCIRSNIIEMIVWEGQIMDNTKVIVIDEVTPLYLGDVDNKPPYQYLITVDATRLKSKPYPDEDSCNASRTAFEDALP